MQQYERIHSSYFQKIYIKNKSRERFKIAIRTFKSGAIRDTEEGKLDLEGSISPLVIERFAQYMLKNNIQSDGKTRTCDNWQKGMPKNSYMKSGWRHFLDWWKEHRGYKSRSGIEYALCGLLFNVQGYLFEILKEKK